MIEDTKRPFSHSPHRTNAQSTKSKPRINFKANNNNHQDNHQKDNRQKSNQICIFYQQGKCKFGDNCKFIHANRNEETRNIEVNYEIASAEFVNYFLDSLSNRDKKLQLKEILLEGTRIDITAVDDTTNTKSKSHKVGAEAVINELLNIPLLIRKNIRSIDVQPLEANSYLVMCTADLIFDGIPNVIFGDMTFVLMKEQSRYYLYSTIQRYKNV